MRNKTNTQESSEGMHMPRALDRFRNRLGFVIGGDSVLSTDAVRPPVGNFDIRRMSVKEYALRNAANAQLDKDDARFAGLSRIVSELDGTYGSYLRTGRKSQLETYGFSKEHPRTVFKWNVGESSIGMAQDLMYVMGAEALSDAEVIDITEGVTRLRQEFTSQTGLNFVDVRDVVADADAQTYAQHALYVFHPAAE